MHVFVEDENFKRIDMIDQYKSLIWTERYDEIGDFKLIVSATDANRSKISLGRYLSIPPSKRRMIVMTSEEENGLITFTGSSMEHILKTRIVKPGTTWNGTTGMIAGMLFNLAFVNYDPKRSFDEADMIPNSVYRYENIPSDATSYTSELETVYTSVKKICGLVDLGFRIDCENVNNAPRLAFTVYKGRERKDVIFDPRIGTLADVRVFRSLSLLANHAITKYMSSDTEKYTTYSKDISFKGDKNLSIPLQLQRSVVYVDGTDISREVAEQADFWRALRSRANSAMTEKAYIRTLTGRSPADSPYVYGKDYDLGDIVKVSTGQDNATALVSEYIWSVSDSEISSYPTFRFNYNAN